MTVSTQPPPIPHHAAHKTGTLSPREQSVLWDMEEHFWTSGADNTRATTATNAVMVFPYPPGILQGDQIWTHLREGTGWRTVAMTERRVMRCRDIAILTYRVSAEKPDVPIYKALCASTYFNDDGTWLRISHQQTAVPEKRKSNRSAAGTGTNLRQCGEAPTPVTLVKSFVKSDVC